MAVVKAWYYRAAFAVYYPCILARMGEYLFIRTNGGYYAVSIAAALWNTPRSTYIFPLISTVFILPISFLYLS